MSRAKHILSISARPGEVKAFLESNRARFLANLKEIRELVETNCRRGRPGSCVYKIYGRGEMQGGEELKHPRKVRLKFHEYNKGRGVSEASLFDVPDIVGLTIVVSYPSDISEVACIIDQLIDGHELCVSTIGAPVMPASEISLIETRHGRPIQSKGYFACHYNLQTNGTGPRPVVEIQIKTVLHDAWGAKTHDLSYKPSGRTDQDLLESFNLLGDVLAKVDQQSDTIRSSIERTARVREKKRERVQLEVLRVPAGRVVRSLTDNDLRLASVALLDRIEALDPADLPGAGKILNDLFNEFSRWPSGAALLTCYLAAKTRHPGHFENAQEAIDDWEDQVTTPMDRLWARSSAALAAYGAGAASEAIDLAEEAVLLFDDIEVSELSMPERNRLDRMANSLFSSLAYYHADRVGSHEGSARDSVNQARIMLDRAAAYSTSFGVPVHGLDSTDQEIEVALSHAELGGSVFATLDNEAFVRIQTATSEAELRRVRARLQFLHDKKPVGSDPLASLLFDFHDYCARMRLAELEADG